MAISNTKFTAIVAGTVATLVGAVAIEAKANPQRDNEGGIEIDVVVGNETMVFPLATVANLDAPTGDFVAGSSLLVVDEVLFAETRAGFLWDTEHGAIPFDIDADTYWAGVDHFPSAIADTAVVAGTEVNFREYMSRGYTFSQADGLRYLTGLSGTTVAAAYLLSQDGSVVYGSSSASMFDEPRGSFWIDGRARPLQTPRSGGLWYSQPNDVSANGQFAVGAMWRDGTTRAARWDWGRLVPLARFSGSAPEGTVANYLCDSDTQALGTATLAGLTGIARWGTTRAEYFAPPAGATVAQLGDSTPDCATVVGTLTVNGNNAPFIWNEAGGYEVIGELGREEDYDLSAALFVTDDGTIVGGNLSSTVVVNGDPPRLAFLWSRTAGTVAVNDLLTPYIADSDFYHLVAMSADGRELLLEGNIRDPVYNSGAPEVSPNALVRFPTLPIAQ